MNILSEGIFSDNLLRSYHIQDSVLRIELKYVVKSIVSVDRGEETNAFLFFPP